MLSRSREKLLGRGVFRWRELYVRGAVSGFYSGRDVDFFLPLLLAFPLVSEDRLCLAEVEKNSLGVKFSGSESVLVSSSLWSVLALGLVGGLVCKTAREMVSLLALLGSAHP